MSHAMLPTQEAAPMLAELEARRDALAQLCRRFAVERLEVFGSAAREADFTPSAATWTSW